MGLRDIDIGQAMRNLADRRIEEAMKEGKFDNLTGMGQALDLEPPPADENARMLWWCLRIFKANDLVPDEVRYRKSVDNLRAALAAARDEAQVRRLVAQANAMVHKVNTLGTNAINVPIAPLDLEEELRRFRARGSDAFERSG